MSVFYLLPPRPLLGKHFANYLKTVLPGMDWDRIASALLTDTLETATSIESEDVHIVYREEVEEADSAFRALVDGFGAEEGDEVIEVRPGTEPGELVACRWAVCRES